MDGEIEDLETENISLTERVELETQKLLEQVTGLEKPLNKQTKLHREFVDDVVETERIRLGDFNKERQEFIKENKSLVGQNRQLTKDVLFYKNAYEELAKQPTEAEPTNKQLGKPVLAESQTLVQSTSKSTGSYFSTDCNHKTSQVLTKINEKLFLENKKLKLKVNNLTETNRHLNKKTQQLENTQKKFNNEKLDTEGNIDELAKLVDSANVKNKHIFTPEVLAKLNELSK